MKILHVVPFIGDEASGPAYSVPALCDALGKEGLEVKLFTLNPFPTRERAYSVHGFNRTKCLPSLGLSYSMYKNLLKEAKTCDIIHNHSLWMAPNILAGLVAEREKIIFVNAPRGTLSSVSLERSRLKKKIALFFGQQRTLKKTTCFHATAEHEARDIRRLHPHTSVSIVPNGIDLPELLPTQESPRTVLFLGRLHPIKGLENLLRAWKEVERIRPEWNLELVGKGQPAYIEELKELISRLELQKATILGPAFGQRKNLFYQKADLYVLPSYTENFGMTVVEALANGTPVITTTGTPWGNLNSKSCGWVVEPSKEGLEHSLICATDKSRESLKAWGQNGRKWMEEEYSWKSIARKMKETYTWLEDPKNDKPDFII